MSLTFDLLTLKLTSLLLVPIETFTPILVVHPYIFRCELRSRIGDRDCQTDR